MRYEHVPTMTPQQPGNNWWVPYRLHLVRYHPCPSALYHGFLSNQIRDGCEEELIGWSTYLYQRRHGLKERRWRSPFLS